MPIEIIAVAIIVFCIIRAIVKKIKEIRKSHYRDVIVHMPYEALRSRRACEVLTAYRGGSFL